METNMPEWVTLDANLPRVLAARAAFKAKEDLSLSSRANARAKMKETAADAGFGAIQMSDIQSFDLAIHKDTFLDDAAITRDATSKEALFWKSHYDPTVGVYMGSVYGGPPASFYQTQDYFGTLQNFTVDTEEIKVPNMGYTVNPADLQIRDRALARQAEAIKLKGEQFLMNSILGQPLGQDLAVSIASYVALGNPYAGKTVYIADPGVQLSTLETSNIINLPSAGGLTPALFEAITSLALKMKRKIRTVHIPAAGEPWRKLMRFAGITNNLTGPLTGPGNGGLNGLPEALQSGLWNQNYYEGFVFNWFGMPLKFKVNNALPEGYAIITTDQPAAEIINITDLRVSVDYTKDPHSPYFSTHYEKFTWAIAAPNPWARNFLVVAFGATSGL